MKNKVLETADDGRPEQVHKGNIFERVSKWFHNYWYYYKFHFIAALVLLFVVIVSVRSCVTSTDVDLVVYYISGTPLLYDEDQINLTERFSQYTPDFDGDGQVRVEIVNLCVSDDYYKGLESMQDQAKENRDEFSSRYSGGAVTLIMADEEGLQFLRSGTYLCDMTEYTDSAVSEGDAWCMTGSGFADSELMQIAKDKDLYLSFRIFGDRSIIRIIPGKTKEVEFAQGVLKNIIDNKPVSAAYTAE